MECKRDGLASIGEALSSLDGPGKKTLQTSPQSRHHFTQADQRLEITRKRRKF